MKKIYLSILASTFAISMNAQLTLTKAANEPIVGNISAEKGYDSTNVIPKSTGAGQSWNFSSLTTNTIVESTTYTTVASSPSASAFPGATLAETDGAGAWTYWKSTTSTFELMGMIDPNTVINFSNTAVAAVWPISMGYNNTDAFAGSAAIQTTLTGSAIGTITSQGTGTGTVTLPGSLVFTNMLQLRTNQILQLNLMFGLVTATMSTNEYSYYHSSQKFPLITVSYQKAAGSFTSSTCDIRINSAVAMGVNEATFDKAFVVYPNPASGLFHVMFTNEKNESLSLEIMNGLGQTLRQIDLGSGNDINTTINVSDMGSGVYFIKTTIGNTSVVKKLVIQ